MILIALRDVLWRWRRFMVALVATALVLALTLVLDGVNRSFPNEARRTVAAFDAGAWLVPEGSSGVFLSSTVLPDDTSEAAAGLAGAEEAGSVAVLRAALDDETDINVIGVQPGRFTDPPVVEGRAPAAPGEATVERGMGYDIGDRVVVDGRPLAVVGQTSGLSFRAGVPSLYVDLADAQAIGYQGAPLATTVVTKGLPTEMLDGYEALASAEVAEDLLAPLAQARQTIGLVLALLWVVAAMVIGSVVYLTSIDRARDFAVLKATGATDHVAARWPRLPGRAALGRGLPARCGPLVLPRLRVPHAHGDRPRVLPHPGRRRRRRGSGGQRRERPPHPSHRSRPRLLRSLTVLLVEDLTVEYQSGDYLVRPLDGFNLQAKAGELVLLLGASGCGKTTLLSALAGILTPQAGRVVVGGTDITLLDSPGLVAYRRSGVGVVFQAFNLVPSLSASENVQAALRIAGVRAPVAKARAAELLDRVGLADRASSKPGQLSGGQQQRVAIARALAHDPPLILADEPTAHLDYVQCEIVLTLLRELAGGGRTVVIATHDDRLLPLADRVIELTPRFEGGSGRATSRHLSAGELLFRQGDASDLVYLIEEGSIDVLRELADGSSDHLATLGPGRYVGELGPLLGLQRSATARAATDCALQVCSPQEFRASVGRSEGGTGPAASAGGNGSAPPRRRRTPLQASPRR